MLRAWVIGLSLGLLVVTTHSLPHPTSTTSLINQDNNIQSKLCSSNELELLGGLCTISCPPGNYVGSCQEEWSSDYSSVTGVANCEECPAGYYDIHPDLVCNYCEECGAGTYSREGATQCLECSRSCPEGSEIAASCSPESDTQCRCKPGFAGVSGMFSASDPTATCSRCEDSFQNLPGQLSCNRCGTCDATTTTTDNTTVCGGVTDTKCFCKAGFKGHEGSFAFGDVLCTGCDPNTHQPLPGKSTCLPCPANTRSSESAIECTPILKCELGNYLDESGNCHECSTDCPAGSHPSGEPCTINNDLKCTCDVGFAGRAGSFPASEGPVCKQCEGSFQAARGQEHCRTCTQCDLTSMTLVPGSCNGVHDSLCQCAPGSAGFLGSFDPNSENNQNCAACEAGKYQAIAGQESCLECSDETASFVGATECVACSELKPLLQMPNTES